MASRTSRTVRRFAAVRLPPAVDRYVAPVGAVLALLGLEVAARLSSNEAQDAAVLVGLVLLALMLRALHQRDPRPWTRALAGALGATVDRVRGWALDLGVDLRGDPPIARGHPRLLLVAGAIPPLLVVSALLFAPDPVLVRAGVGAVSGLVAVAGMGLLWAVSLLGAFAMVALTFARVHDELVHRHVSPQPRSLLREASLYAVVLAGMVAGWVFAPADWAFWPVAAAVLVAVTALALPGVPDLPVLWRPGGAAAPVRTTGWKAISACSVLALAGAALLPMALVHAAALRAGGGAEPGLLLPVTTRLAGACGWAGMAAVLLFGADTAATALHARRWRLLRRTPPRVAVSVADPVARPAVRAALLAAGLDPREGRSADGDALVQVHVRPDGSVVVDGGAVTLAPGALADPRETWRVRRRHEIRCRRHLVRGMARAFRIAAGLELENGCGYWLAPHLAWSRGLSRDEGEVAAPDGGRWTTVLDETIGPAWTAVIPAPALAHLGEVLDGLDIDLVFVEDGVDFRRFRRVLRLAFETYDMLGGRQRAEEVHFSGLPGVRCLLLDFDMQKPYAGHSKRYPEPGYEEIGRARILYVFRDRGATESPVRDPSDVRGEPLLV